MLKRNELILYEDFFSEPFVKYVHKYCGGDIGTLILVKLMFWFARYNGNIPLHRIYGDEVEFFAAAIDCDVDDVKKVYTVCKETQVIHEKDGFLVFNYVSDHIYKDPYDCE